MSSAALESHREAPHVDFKLKQLWAISDTLKIKKHYILTKTTKIVTNITITQQVEAEVLVSSSLSISQISKHRVRSEHSRKEWHQKKKQFSGDSNETYPESLMQCCHLSRTRHRQTSCYAIFSHGAGLSHSLGRATWLFLCLLLTLISQRKWRC